MEPDNILMGDDNYGVDLPEAQVTQPDLSEELQMAAFTRTKEYERINDWALSRIEFYETFLPDGRSLEDKTPTVEDWRVANRIIAEFKGLLGSYKSAVDTVTELQQGNNE